MDLLARFTLCMWLLALLVPTSVSAFETRTYRFPYQQRIVKDGYQGPYSTTVWKVQHVMTGKTVVIDKPIKTNGGDILIIGDVIDVRAPIDTRVHVTLNKPFWVLSGVGREAGSLDVHLVGRRDLWRRFFAYMLWSHHYDEARKVYTYWPEDPEPWFDKDIEGAHYYYRQKPGQRRPMPWNALHIPQMPSGRITRALYNPDARGSAWTPSIGEDAPTTLIDSRGTRSGNITIIASTILFCRTCGTNQAYGATIPEGDLGDIKRPIFFQAAGLKGGYGGAGTLGDWCTYVNMSRNDPCLPVYKASGGLSGRAGPGGDAGDIQFYLVNPVGKQTVAAEKNLATAAEACKRAMRIAAPDPARNLVCRPSGLGRSLAWLSDVESGYPPYWGVRRKTDSAFNLARGKGRWSPGFTAVPAADGPIDTFVGRKGRISIQEVRSDRAVSLMASNLLKMEVYGAYDYGRAIELLGDRASTSKFRFSPMDALIDYLEDALRDLQVQTIEAARAQVVGGEVPPPPRFLATLRTIRCSPQITGGLSGYINELLLEICRFRTTPGQTGVTSYLIATGGLLRSGPVGLFDRYQSMVQLYVAVDAARSIKQVRIELIKTRNIYEQSTFRQELRDLADASRSMSARLSALDAKRSQLVKQAKLSTGSSSSAFGKLAGKAYASYQTGDWIGFVRNTGAMIDYIQPSFDDPQLAWQLRVEIAAVEAAKKTLTEKAAIANRLNEADSASGLLAVYRDVDMQRSARRSALLDFGPMLRAVLIDEVGLPSDGHADLRRNLQSLSTLVQNFPAPSQAINVVPYARSCRADSPSAYVRGRRIWRVPWSVAECLDIAPSSRRRIIYVELGKGVPALPLLAVPPNSGHLKVALPTSLGGRSIFVL